MPSQPSLHDMLDGLITTPSVSCTHSDIDMSNRPVIELLAEWLENEGYSIRLQELDGQPGKANLIATLGQGPGGLVLSGHSDTVPCDPQLWQHDPFKLTEHNGRYYGLGTSDMKSFFALAIEAARSFNAKDFKQPLILLATADEETSMSGAQAITSRDLPAKSFALIGEPTGMKPIRQHKGIMMERISLQGQAGHSSDPSLGNNALEGMHEVMTMLLAWRTELQAKHQNPAFGVPVPTLNLGCIHGGDNPNRICGACSLEIDLRPLPGMALSTLRQTLYERTGEIALRRGLTADFTQLFSGIDAFQTDAMSPIVLATEELTQHQAATVAFGTEGPYFNALGIDTVVLGAADIDQAHQPDEYLDIERIEPTLEIIKGLIQRFCCE